jgi:hypothetical protein
MRRGLTILLAVLGLPPMRADAQDAVTIADIRCVVVGMQLSGMVNSALQPRGILLTLYYIGRLDGRVPKLDIESLLIEETGKMESADYASEGRRCEAGLTEKGQQIIELGKHLIERGK